MRMSLIQKLDAQTHYGITSNTVFSDSRLTLANVQRLTYLVSSQDVANGRSMEIFTADVINKLFAHDYRLIHNLYPSLESIAASNDPHAAHQFLVDLRCTLEEIRNQYMERYTPLVLKEIKEDKVEFNPRTYLAGSLSEDVDRLIREGISGEDLKHLYPSRETHKSNALLLSCHADFVRRCDEYTEDNDPKTLRKAVAILVAVNASI